MAEEVERQNETGEGAYESEKKEQEFGDSCAVRYYVGCYEFVSE